MSGGEPDARMVMIDVTVGDVSKGSDEGTVRVDVTVTVDGAEIEGGVILCPQPQRGGELGIDLGGLADYWCDDRILSALKDSYGVTGEREEDWDGYRAALNKISVACEARRVLRDAKEILAV